jgi:hypothetical protein
MGQPDIVVEMAKPYLDIAFSLFHLLFFRHINNLLMGNQILKVLGYHWERHQCHRQLFFDLWDLDFS